jgi:hypothetical protein
MLLVNMRGDSDAPSAVLAATQRRVDVPLAALPTYNLTT